MSKFDRYNYTDNKYKKPVKSGDYVYIFDTDELYESETIYKVHCIEEEEERILVEVDLIKNKADLDTILGWSRSTRGTNYIEHYKLKRDKLYWWVSAWLKANNIFINNE